MATGTILALTDDPLTAHVPTIFVPSPNRTANKRPRVWRLWVLHTMEGSEHPQVAENLVSGWFAKASTRASTHWAVDNNSLAQSVDDDRDLAWHAPGANHDALGIEQAGTAAQNPTQWADRYSSDMIDLSARAFVVVGHRRHGLPIRRLTIPQIADGITRGICGHHDISLAFGRSDHWDPGPSYPWELWLDLVRRYAGTHPEEEPLMTQVTGQPDAVTTAPGQITVSGWAAYPGTPGDPVPVTVALPDLGIARTQPTGRGRATPDAPIRGDVTAAFGYPADVVGYDLTIDNIPAGEHLITVAYAGTRVASFRRTVGPVLNLPTPTPTYNRDAALGHLSDAHAAIDRAAGELT